MNEISGEIKNACVYFLRSLADSSHPFLIGSGKVDTGWVRKATFGEV